MEDDDDDVGEEEEDEVKKFVVSWSGLVYCCLLDMCFEFSCYRTKMAK